MSSSNMTGAPKAPSSSWNLLQRINRSRQQHAAAKAERQVNKQWLDAQRRRLQPAPTLPASPPCGGVPLQSGAARLGNSSRGGVPLNSGSTLRGGPSRGGAPLNVAASPRATSGYAQWHPDAFVKTPRRGIGASARTSKSFFKRGWRSTQRVARQGDGVSKRRYWKGIATAAAAGLAAGMLILSAMHLAVAALAVGCIGFMGMLVVAAFRKRGA